MTVEFLKMPIRKRRFGYDGRKSNLGVRFLTFWLFDYHLVVTW